MYLSESSHPRNRKYPEKVLQFGTGVLLRGLCDYFIDKANKKGEFNGSVVVVKSTPGSSSDFDEQNNLYTLCVRGTESGKQIKENIVNESISRVISASDQWEAIKAIAVSEDLELIISNTTEVGLVFKEEKIGENCPESFPAKLTALLYERYKAGQTGLVIIPTELISENGSLLKSFVMKHVDNNFNDSGFITWLQEENAFCNSLVDRIVPGKPSGDELAELYNEIGYEDKLITKCEVYRLWAIEGDDSVENRIGFAGCDPGLIIDKDITKYKELKLRLLNAPHTLMCALSYLSGFDVVKDTLKDDLMEKYFTILMLTELAPALPDNIDVKAAQRYGRSILDRFRNPFISHLWHSISFQYTMKMRMRTIPLLQGYYAVFDTVPHYFARGFAAYLLFMKATKEENGQYFGDRNGEAYLINCDQAAYFKQIWESNDVNGLVKEVLSNKEMWGLDLTQFHDFEESVATHLSNMQALGVKEVANALNVYA